jgi:uncharacterized membrane-anchored protein YjiN (DUF445 family)
MKLIAVLIGLAVVVLVIVGYELLMKLAKNEDKPVNQDIVKAAEKILQEQEKQLTEAIKTKINEVNKPTTKKIKSKTKLK